MCGIIGYMGSKPVVPVLLEGLQKLEYRGYDSAGLALVQDGLLSIRRASGKLINLARSLEFHPLNGQYGIGHMRWATHGLPSEENAHPHRDCTGRIALVHNGIIENYHELKSDLQKAGHDFKSETDSEVIAHLVEAHLPGRSLEEAVANALPQLRGSYAICLIASDAPQTIIAARNGSSLILGLGEGEWLIASEIPALLQHTQRVHFMCDGEMAVISAAGVRLLDSEGRSCPLLPQEIRWSPGMVEKAGYRHFMLKEINEQPRAVRDTVLGRVSPEADEVFLEEAALSDPFIAGLERICFVGCGTSWHAALFGKFILEQVAGIPVDVDYSSEFRHRSSTVNERTLLVAISQSGETPDTLGAVEQARAGKARVLSVCNVVGSTLSRRSDGAIHTRSGPEIGAASTKAFTGQLVALFLLSLFVAAKRGRMTRDQVRAHLGALARVPLCIEQVLSLSGQYEKIARSNHKNRNFLCLGRGPQYPIALEGALKLKEISHVHAEGFPAGEVRHGANMLIDANLPVIVLAARDAGNPASVLRYEEMLNDMEVVRIREGSLIVLATEGDTRVSRYSNQIIYLPELSDSLIPLLLTIPLQLIAYHIAVQKDLDVDQPRGASRRMTFARQ